MEAPNVSGSPPASPVGGAAPYQKMPRYTYYLSNYQYLRPSANQTFSADDDKSHTLSPKFGAEQACDDASSFSGDAPMMPGGAAAQFSERAARGSPCLGDSALSVASDAPDPSAAFSPRFGKTDGLSVASDSQGCGKMCSVDGNDELGSASVADDYYSDSSRLLDEQRDISRALYADHAIADKVERWLAHYAAGNMEEFRKKQQESMEALSRQYRSEGRLEEFPIRCLFVWGETGSDGKFDPLYIKVGDVLVQRYHVVEILGNTAFSVVLRARDERTGADVCVKISMPDTVSQAIDEINLLKILNTTNPDECRAIVQLHDYFYFRGCVFSILEILGANLYEATREMYKKRKVDPALPLQPEFSAAMDVDGRHGWPLSAIRQIATDILRSLNYMHSLGIINCDLKPENIVLNNGSDSPVVKLIDFGSSCYIQESLSSYVQSRSYRAPEVILGLPYDTQIDLWSLGCVLCEIYMQRILFPSDNNATLMASMISLLGVPPVYILEHKMNSTFMVLPNGNVADLSVSTEVLKNSQKLLTSDYQSSMRCNMSVSNSSCGSVVAANFGHRADTYTNADADSLLELNSTNGDGRLGAASPEYTNITPRKYSIMQNVLVSQCDAGARLQQVNKGIKVDFCHGRANAKCVRIIEPTPCSIDEMLGTAGSPALAAFGDFVKGLLQYDPLERLTAATALSHSFITQPL
ncbi:serine/threonine protein kinase [Babesia caballi]|uniref:Serine/threonine protein kinase n=1 Tax=Babesia caballi TaxID=5871 RepID=A0AAV4LN31_BABCB|nr:serine/threonine protein kinase [Babesia caballi]